ncbi:PD40 domain-containing protein [Kitasatospora sp. CMC57]|uniref:PD40 domain-containing protein n=1 Tax=Kitasatospora sp. CMC57 TaxID=3231513 RepID=A0AB33JRI9_9ACTN
MNALSPRARLAVVLLAVLLLGGGSLGYVLRARQHAEPQRTTADSSFTLAGPRLYYRDSDTGRVAYRPPGPDAASVVGGPSCERFHAAGDTALCLQRLPGLPARADVVVLDRQLRETRRITLPGIPNRARVSASGRMLAWTMFATGDSYATSAFSTRTSILDLNTGYLIKSMEQIPLTIDGARYHAPDINYWGVTFARDDNRFYATASTNGRTYLVEGDLAAWSATALRENVECPSLSPDNSRIAFKKRVSEGTDSPWRLYVLDLRTMTEQPLAESRSVDDQAAWLDDSTVAYALPNADGRTTDLWSVPANGAGTPRLAVPGASSPVAVG